MDQRPKDAEYEAKLAALRAALIEGEESGFIEDFDFDALIAELNAKHRGRIKRP